MKFNDDAFRKIKKKLEDIINPTPLQHSRTFGEMAGCNVYLKPECLQKNGSFKIRGAFAAISSLSDEMKARGIITSSGGNWAQGVAYCCQLLKIKALIVMPEHVSRTKYEATLGYGAEVLLYGSSSVDLFRKVKELSEEKQMTWIHAFAEPVVPTLHATLLGYGSMGLEVMEEKPDIDAIVVPVGGGALISGIALAVKQINPDLRIIGVQAERASAMHASLKKGRVVEIDKIETIADGICVKRPDEQTFRIVQKHVDEIVLVSEDEIKKALILLLERANLLVEPSGATPLAAVLNRKIESLASDSNVALLLSGGNIDQPVLKQLLD